MISTPGGDKREPASRDPGGSEICHLRCYPWRYLKGLFIKFSKFNPRLYGSNGLGAFSSVFAQAAIPIYSQLCNIKGQILARV